MASIKVTITSPFKLPVELPMEFVLSRETSIADLKQLIHNRFPSDNAETLAPSLQRQRLIFRGRVLDENETFESILHSNKIPSASSILFHLVIRPLDTTENQKLSWTFFSLFGRSSQSLLLHLHPLLNCLQLALLLLLFNQLLFHMHPPFPLLPVFLNLFP